MLPNKPENMTIDFNLNDNAKQIVIWVGCFIVTIAFFILLHSFRPKKV